MTPTPSLQDDLCSDIQPLCPHDNSVMVYQPTYLSRIGVHYPNVFEGFLPSYGCVEPDCTARFRHTQGYFTVEGSSESRTMVPIAGVNIVHCPTHRYWLYMNAPTASEKDIAWCCAVRGCGHVQHSSDIPGSRAK